MTLKNGFGKCSLFASSANGWTDQNMDSSFSRKKIHNMEKALFDWPIVLQYEVKAKYRLISRKFFGREVFSPERSLNQPKATRVCIRSINQSNCFICVRSLFLFCSRVFISRSYENRSIRPWRLFSVDVHLTNVAIQKTAPDYDAEKVTIVLFAFYVTLFNSKTFYYSHFYETQF